MTYYLTLLNYYVIVCHTVLVHLGCYPCKILIIKGLVQGLSEIIYLDTNMGNSEYWCPDYVAIKLYSLG